VSKADKHSKVQHALRYLVWLTTCLRDMSRRHSPRVCTRSLHRTLAPRSVESSIYHLHRHHHLTGASTDISPAFCKVNVTCTTSPGRNAYLTPRARSGRSRHASTSSTAAVKLTPMQGYIGKHNTRTALGEN